jgi:hypothetical protein
MYKRKFINPVDEFREYVGNYKSTIDLAYINYFTYKTIDINFNTLSTEHFNKFKAFSKDVDSSLDNLSHITDFDYSKQLGRPVWSYFDYILSNIDKEDELYINTDKFIKGIESIYSLLWEIPLIHYN